MQLSIGKIVATLIALLITVTVITTGAGLYVASSDYRALDNRHVAEARDTLRNATIAIRNQIRFYQGILQLISANPEVSNLIEFGEVPEITRWSHAVGRLLPGTLGTALTGPDGVFFGDPLALRVGSACQHDMHTFLNGGAIDYPLLHADVAGFEHFDLLAKVTSPTGERAGTLFVSFRLDILEDLLDSMRREGDQFLLLGRDGQAKLTVGETGTAESLQTFRLDIPDTSWELLLTRPAPVMQSLISDLLITDIAILAVFGVLIVLLVRTALLRFRTDMLRVHSALESVLAGNYQPSDTPTAVKETGILLQDIEQLALKIQRQRDELRHQSLSDPLTGVFNRRYFDLMLAHHHEQSRRQKPATLVIIDLNDFKHINDEFGHTGGDQVLQQAARFLRSRVRTTDIVARLGGDEFALILNQMSHDDLESWLTKLVNDYDNQFGDEPFDTMLRCQFSIGAAQIDAERYPTHAEVFRAADNAMYSMKQSRGGRRSRFAIARQDNVTPIGVARETP